jgi:glutathione synthase/RimK-type ligase-like ATP-grasp enzyme
MALNANFCSVDIAEVNGKYKVVEVNGGVMMEKFSSQSIENYNIAKSIYASAINKLFKK